MTSKPACREPAESRQSSFLTSQYSQFQFKVNSTIEWYSKSIRTGDRPRARSSLTPESLIGITATGPAQAQIPHLQPAPLLRTDPYRSLTHPLTYNRPLLRRSVHWWTARGSAESLTTSAHQHALCGVADWDGENDAQLFGRWSWRVDILLDPNESTLQLLDSAGARGDIVHDTGDSVHDTGESGLALRDGESPSGMTMVHQRFGKLLLDHCDLCLSFRIGEATHRHEEVRALA